MAASQGVNDSAKGHLQIEESVMKLRKALQHWQTLEIDYEGLKDEIEGLPETMTTKSQLLHAVKEFGPEKLDEKDLGEIFQTNGKLRCPSQIVDVLTKRIEYVRKNIESLRKRLSDLEKQRNALLLAGNPDQGRPEDADLEQADITEQLDDDGNVISSHVKRGNENSTGAAKVQHQVAQPESELASGGQTDVKEKTKSKIQVAQNARSSASKATSQSDQPLVKNDARTDLLPINPDDTEEEAQLRQDMLQYGLPEVGNIVAELEMAESDEDFDEEDEGGSDEFDDEYDDSEDEESEDEHGRSTRSTISNKYRRKMEQLQQELGVSMENIGPSTDLPPDDSNLTNRPPAAEAARKAALARYEAAKSAIKSMEDSEIDQVKDKPRKKVAFARSLDIATNTPKFDSTDEISGTNSPKMSRFKATRASQPQTPLFPPPMTFPLSSKSDTEGPPGRIVVDTLVERLRKQNDETDTPAPPDDDDFDEGLQKRQIALEHHRLRNKKIHEQGGYVGGGELDNWGEEHAAPTILDEKTGQPRKISRFKAARVKG